MNSVYRSSPQATVSARSSAKRSRPSLAPRKWPVSVTPAARSVRRWRSWPPPCPVAWKFATSRAAGLGRDSTAASDEAGLDYPPGDVAIAEAARRPGRLPAGENYLAAGLVQLLRDLAAGLAAADYEHAPRAAAPARCGSPGRRSAGGRAAGSTRPPDGARADRRPWPGPPRRRAGRRPMSRERSRLPQPLHGGNRDAFPDGRFEARRVALQVRDDLVTWHEAVRVRPVVVAAGKPNHPVRRHQAEAVPAPSPRLAYASPLEHDMVNAGSRQLVTRGEAGLAGADHCHRDALFCVHCDGPALATAGPPARETAFSGGTVVRSRSAVNVVRW